MPASPYHGLVAPTEAPGSGSYAAGVTVMLQLHAFREVNGQRVYAGVAYQRDVAIGSNGSGVEWPAWSASPSWVTGYALLRFEDYIYTGHRMVTLATMQAGWLDTGSGWSGGLPVDFNNPPVTVKAVWNATDEYGLPQVVSVVASPLGGWAFDATLGDHLGRAMSDDLRRCPDVTMAYWVCPADGTSGVLSALRGIFGVSLSGNYSCVEPDLSFGDTTPVEVADHQDGDWYLLVIRRDDLADEYKKDLVRLRDRAQFSTETTLAGEGSAVLTGSDDYFQEGIWGVVAFGSSFHWVGAGPVQGYGYFDRMALWDRALSDEEVLDLFNNGLGWQPG